MKTLFRSATSSPRRSVCTIHPDGKDDRKSLTTHEIFGKYDMTRFLETEDNLCHEFFEAALSSQLSLTTVQYSGYSGFTTTLHAGHINGVIHSTNEKEDVMNKEGGGESSPATVQYNHDTSIHDSWVNGALEVGRGYSMPKVWMMRTVGSALTLCTVFFFEMRLAFQAFKALRERYSIALSLSPSPAAAESLDDSDNNDNNGTDSSVSSSLPAVVLAVAVCAIVIISVLLIILIRRHRSKGEWATRRHMIG